MKTRYFFLFFALVFALNLQAQQANNMTLLGTWQDPSLPDAGNLSYNEVWGHVDCNGNEYAIMGSSAFIHFFDLADPTNPVEVDAYTGGSATIWRDMKTYQDFAYSVCDNCTEGMMVFDMSELPDTVKMVNQMTDQFTTAHNIFIDTDLGWLFAVGGNVPGNVTIYDLNVDKVNPPVLASPTLAGGYVHDIYVRDGIAYASHGNPGLNVYDFNADPANPMLLGSIDQYPEEGYNHASWLSEDGNTLIMVDETHNTSVKSVDVSDLTDMAVIDLFRSELLAPDATGSIVHNPFIRGNYLFASYYHDGIQVFDISNPNDVIQVAGYDTEPDNTDYGGFTGCWGAYPFLPSGLILASDTHRGLFVLEMSADISLIPVETASYPDAFIIETGETTFCQGSGVTLQLPPNGESYQWYLDDAPIEEANGLSIYANQTGNYSATIAQQHCVSTTSAIETAAIPYPSGSYTSTENIDFCESDIATLTADEGAEYYEWYWNGTQISGQFGNILETPEHGEYYFLAFNGDGECGATSSGILLEPADLGTLSINTDSAFPLCPGTEAVFEADDIYNNYVWYLNEEIIENENDNTLNIMDGGSYSVIGYLNQCTASGSIAAEYHELIPASISYDGGDLVASEGASYQWYNEGLLLEGETNQVFTPTVDGDYTVEVTDANGCTSISGIFVIMTGVHDLGNSENVSIFPNPFEHALTININSSATEATWRVTDLAGRTVLMGTNEFAYNGFNVDTRGLVSGIYVLELTLNGQTIVEKLVKH